MPEWTRDMVEERIIEAAAVLKRMPSLRSHGYFSTWPEIQRSRKEIAEGMPRPMRLPPPSTAAITRMEEAITWNRFLEPDDAHLMWAKAEGARWKELCYRFGISRPTAHRRWEYALSVIVWRLNGRSINRSAAGVPSRTNRVRSRIARQEKSSREQIFTETPEGIHSGRRGG